MKTFGMVLAVCLFGLGCRVQAPATYSVPSDTGEVCRRHCQGLGMELGAVVIMGNSAGCVCSVPGAPATSTHGGAAAAYIIQQQREQDQHNAAAQQQQTQRR